MDLLFRETQEADIESLFRVREHTRENPVTRKRLARIGVTPSSVADALRSDEMKGWLCEHESAVVAFCSGEAATGEVLVLAVLPAYEGRGIGKRLLVKVVQWLRSEGNEKIWLAASPDPSTRAYGFYRSQGWRPTGETDGHGDEILILEGA